MKNIAATLVGTAMIGSALCAAAQATRAPLPPAPQLPPPATLPHRELRLPQPPPPGAEAHLKAAELLKRLEDEKRAYPPQFLGSGAGGPGASGVDRSRTLIIPGEAAEPQDLAQTEEDLNVMARILDKAVNAGEDPGKLAMGIHIQNSVFGGGSPRNMYLAGYGAVFILNVPFPLLPPSTKSDEPENKQETSSEWDAARQELYSGSPQGFALDLSNLAFAGRFGSPPPYDQGKVEELKENLISALKNAAHIRTLQPEELVTVVVNGGGTSQAKVVSAKSRSALSVLSHSTDRTPGSRIILRAKRADIEAFQKGNLDLDQFRDKVTITVS